MADRPGPGRPGPPKPAAATDADGAPAKKRPARARKPKKSGDAAASADRPHDGEGDDVEVLDKEPKNDEDSDEEAAGGDDVDEVFAANAQAVIDVASSDDEVADDGVEKVRDADYGREGRVGLIKRDPMQAY